MSKKKSTTFNVDQKRLDRSDYRMLRKARDLQRKKLRKAKQKIQSLTIGA